MMSEASDLEGKWDSQPSLPPATLHSFISAKHNPQDLAPVADTPPKVDGLATHFYDTEDGYLSETSMQSLTPPDSPTPSSEPSYSPLRPRVADVGVTCVLKPVSIYRRLWSWNTAGPRLPYPRHPSDALGNLLQSVPPEIYSMIFWHVIFGHDDLRYLSCDKRSHVRHQYSRLSLVSREWNHIFRARLFEQIRLESLDDMHFLLKMLRGRRNGWLPMVVTQLELHIKPLESGAPIDLESIIRSLSRKLPRLRKLDYYTPLRLYMESPLPTLGAALRPSLACYTELRSISLHLVSFSSVSVIIRLLGAVPRLESLSLRNVEWVNKQLDDRAPERIPLFQYLISIDVWYTEAPWAFAWLLLPMFTRRYIPPAVTVAMRSLDARLVVLLVKTLYRMHQENYRMNMEYHPGANELIIRCFSNPFSTEVASTSRIVLSPSICALSDGRYSCVRHVELHVSASAGLLDSRSEWEAVDASFAKEAVSLEQLTIRVDSGSEYKEHAVWEYFPRLSEQGRFVMRS